MLRGSVTALIFFSFCSCDIYLHNPRGSNNRLNERRATRENNNRLFDSQNNNRGGYNVGDRNDVPSGSNQDDQYQMRYFQSGPNPETSPSELTVVWTNQHGCGVNEVDNPNKLNCQILLQFMCCDEDKCDERDDDDDLLRDGTQRGDTDFEQGARDENIQATLKRRRKNNNNNANKGRQESWDHYNDCRTRDANGGLFLADQRRKSNLATNTRQNPNGNRNAMECAEERDYYPYWHPSPWIDIAVLTSNASLCDYYSEESGNLKPKGKCFEEGKRSSRFNVAADCVKNNGKWKEVYHFLEKDPALQSKHYCEKKANRVWGTPRDALDPDQEACLVLPPKLICQKAPFTRTNHLGNTPDATPANFTWRLPHFPSGKTKICAMRIRYNVSTDDYHPFETDSSVNGKKKSPVQDNPDVSIDREDGPKLRLAINTDQYGRTFQDRSHVFQLKPRPDGVPKGTRIINLNVMGKRGNIVQVYPGVEYDFVPNNLLISTSDLVHVQWTGSNTHDNNSPGGDGQTGDDGRGRGGTDRSNIVEIPNYLSSFPLAFEASRMVNDAKVVWSASGRQKISAKDLAVYLASSGYYKDAAAAKEKKGGNMNALLDNAPASFEGVLLQFKKKASYAFMCSRNNNFSNRSQKAKIIVS